jgi:hypothetical protein
MSVEIAVIGNDATVTAQRRARADSVVAAFSGVLPDRRLLCYLDTDDCLRLKKRYGKAQRGLYMPVANGPMWTLFPEAVGYYVRGNRTTSTLGPDPRPEFDHLIYLHGSTCLNEVGMTMTFAHELQHFIQHENSLELWAVNTVAIEMLRYHKSAYRTLSIQWCDIPIEREARIVAKRIAERIFGSEAVAQYVSAKRDEFVTEQDAADWTCIGGLDATTPYDLATETRLFFPRLGNYASELKAAQGRLGRGFPGVDLDPLLNGTQG